MLLKYLNLCLIFQSLSDASVISSISNSHVIDAVSSVNYDSKLNEYLNMKEVEYSLSAMDIMPDLVGTDNTIGKHEYEKDFIFVFINSFGRQYLPEKN